MDTPFPKANGEMQLRKSRSAVLFSLIMLGASLSALEFGIWEAMATTDQDGDGLSYGLEFFINTQPQDWDTDNDGLPDGWEWQYGLDPLSPSGNNGSTGDPDLDSLNNLNEYLYSIPPNWDFSGTPNVLDNGVWWNGTVPVSNWDEESAMQLLQGSGGDGADEDPMGNICTDTFDNDHDGLVDDFDNDNDGDADCSSDDDDGDGLIDEDVNGWDTDGDGMPDGWEVAYGLDPTSNSNMDGTFGDPDADGLINLYEYVNPAWNTRNGSTFPPTQYFKPGPINMTFTTSPCNPVLELGPGGCEIFTAEVDGITQTDPQNNDTDGDGLNDSYEALVLLTDPTDTDTDGDGISDGIEVNGIYGFPEQPSDPRDNNTDNDHLDDGEEDINGNGIVDEGETDPTRIEDEGDIDNDGLQNWEENLTCTFWDVADSDGGGINDGDELDFMRATNPCMSTIDLEFIILNWDAVENTLLLNSTENINPNPIDWRQSVVPMGYYVLPSGNLTGFRFTSVFGDTLRGIDTEMPVGVTSMIITNGSWCWNATSGAENDPHCDDDYFDLDSDGLADWEELEGTWGYISRINMTDSDGDGVDDLSEIQNSTDPLEPCHNLLDSDGDGLNNYFENNTGCSLSFGISPGNLTLDTYFTLWNQSDSDNGGVSDGQEYIDGTNPQNNPADDINPTDTDGDGIPDTIEQDIGTDWLDPDTDGGGIPDGQECPESFWSTSCIDSNSDPFDSTDDISFSSLYFSASPLTEGADSDLKHYWRWHTYDSYTGVSWGVNSSLLGNTFILPPSNISQGVSDPAFWNSSSATDWEILYESGLMTPGIELIAPYNAFEFDSWTEFTTGLNYSNFTRDIIIDGSNIDSLFVSAPEVIFSPSIRENSTIFTSSSFATDLPDSYLSTAGQLVNDITQQVITESGAVSAWDKIIAIQDFIINGNDTITFLRNHDGSSRPTGSDMDSDISHWILNSSFEGTCDEFTSLFTVMLRHAGMPTRKVTGFSGGDWDGRSYNVYGKDFTWWSEVHLQTNQNQGDLDMGWIPFEACPAMSLVEVGNLSWNPNSIKRDSSGGNISVEGILQFVDNSTTAPNIDLSLYLVSPTEISNIPGSASLDEHLVATTTTDENGQFNLSGFPSEVISPGYASLVIQTTKKNYVGDQGISFSWTINITDNVNITIIEPLPINQPMLGVGVNTTISGQMSWANSPKIDPTLVDNLELQLSFSTTLDGDVTFSSDVGAGGYFEFIVPIQDNEPLGVISASLDFFGWHQDDLNNLSSPQYHANPKSIVLPLNITPSPNMSITLESSNLNNSILDINSFIYLNGTVLSRGINPSSLNGTLSLDIRRSDQNGPYVNIRNWNLNSSSWNATPGDFEIEWFFNESEVPISAGPVEVKLQFNADNLSATDQETFTDIYGIRSEINFNYTLSPDMRGTPIQVDLLLTDHTGTSLANFLGDYSVKFNGTQVWKSSDPPIPRLSVEWTPPVDSVPGDYSWDLYYNGSTWLQPSIIMDQIRIRGRANVSTTISSEWSQGGDLNNPSWISGVARDIVLGTTIIGNNSSISLTLQVPSSLPPSPDGFPAAPTTYNLAYGWIDEQTGEYNLSFVLPADVSSGVYDLRIDLDFAINPPAGGRYYQDNSILLVKAGIQSEFLVTVNDSFAIVVAGDNIQLNATVADVADLSRLSNIAVELYFDWGGPLEDLLETSQSNSEGLVSFNALIPSNTVPGYYELRIFAPDDLTDNLDDENAGRWLNNETYVNLTVQVPSTIDINSIPSEVTALQSFTISGIVMDSVDNNRTIQGPVDLEIFFLDDPEEILVSDFTTNNNGSFSVSVPTDVTGDGITSGVKTLIVSVVNDSSPFYLTGTGDSSILVRGISNFIDTSPLINTVVNRGNSISLGASLVEFSDNNNPLINFPVSVKFHDTWLIENITEIEGNVNFLFSIPNNHPLGLVNVTFFFNGSGTLQSATKIINTITIRSTSFIEIYPILANPFPGDFFNITGSLTSDNGSALTNRQGTLLNSALTFSIDGDFNTFTVSSISSDSEGNWSAELRLDLSFPRGSHEISVQFTPTVGYFSESSNNSLFDSRGYSSLSIISPLDLDPVSRTTRGESLSVDISIIDNSGLPVTSVQFNVSIEENLVATGFTDFNGESSSVITIDPFTTPGPMKIVVSFDGTDGTTGLLGDQSWTRVIILAPTIIEIQEVNGSFIAGEKVTFSGTLTDEHGQNLLNGDDTSGGILHLYVDDIDTGPIYTTQSNATTKIWSISYDVPSDADYGQHSASVKFFGGFTWVDPMGQGDSLNPEYYLQSSANINFNIFQLSQVIITTPTIDVDRNDLVLIEGQITDKIGRALPNRELQVFMNELFITNLFVNENGEFNVFIPIPPDMILGPQNVKIIFTGEQFILASNSSSIFVVHGPAYPIVYTPDSAAVGDSLIIQGTIKDNLQNGWLSNHTVEILVDGVLMGITSSNSTGEWQYSWIIPESLDIGNHTLTAFSPEQGYHRQGISDTNLTIAYHTLISVSVESSSITRGGEWKFNGRLYEGDTPYQLGLEQREISVLLDGMEIEILYTNNDGSFTYNHSLGYQLSRGEHDVKFLYQGELFYLPTNANISTFVRSDIQIEISPITHTIIRSSENHPIKIQGFVREIGGQFNVFENLTLDLYWGDSNLPLRNDPWVNSETFNFQVISSAREFMTPGINNLELVIQSDESRFLNGETIDIDVTVLVSVDFEFSNLDLSNGQRIMKGTVNLTANDTGEPLSGIPMSASLLNGTTTHFSSTKLTNSDGIFIYEFKSLAPLPPLSDKKSWGDLHVQLSSDSNFIDPISLSNLNLDGNLEINYELKSDNSFFQSTVFGLGFILLVSLLVSVFVVLNRRKNSELSEITGIFNYASELLQAGDEMRAAIYECYQNLCEVFMRRGFLRRGFETVREFELAIRLALPGISEDSLVALDRIFEEARYSSHTLGETDRHNAQYALSLIINELQNMQEVPDRDGNMEELEN
jgi:transglutaminase-like putative cysteine protease